MAVQEMTKDLVVDCLHETADDLLQMKGPPTLTDVMRLGYTMKVLQAYYKEMYQEYEQTSEVA